MIPRPFDPATTWWLALAGATAFIALWHTTLVALALASWRLWHRRASARAQYVAACGAFAVAALLTVVTPFALRWRPAPVASAAIERVAAAAPTASSSTRATRFAAATSWSPGATRIASRAVPWLGVLWCTGVLVSLLRFAGAWGIAQWIRRRATPVDAPHLVEAIADASAEWGLPPATLLMSADVDAPVVIGAREPAILLPVHLEQHLDAAALPPLLAHELAHVARRDYAANVVQSLVDALLVFSPGARWISCRVREAREYCCDDVVVDRCGPRPYVEALTSLAGLGAAARARPVLNVAGPRLIVRARRLLQEDAMLPFVRIRIAGAIAALAVAAVAGMRVVPLAARQAANPPTAQASTDGRIPIGFVTRQEGSSVTLRSVVESPEGLCGTAVIRNDADRAVTGLQFIGILTGIDGRRSSMLQLSHPFDVRIEPGAEATVSPNLLPASEARWRMAEGRIQVMCGLTDVSFANGYRWRITPNPAASTAEEVIGLPGSDLPRGLVGRPNANSNLCVTEEGLGAVVPASFPNLLANGSFSQGAVVAIRNEPGRFARCDGGVWVDYALPGPPLSARP